jgi:hypothetical protein
LISVSSFSEDLNNSIFGRFVINEQTGLFAGDNRSDLMEKCWDIFKTSPIIGKGATNLVTNISSTEGFLGANFFLNWASDGILGVLVTYIPLIFLLKLGQIKREYKYTLIIIFLGFLQRPYTDSILLYPIILYTLILFAYLDVNGQNFMRLSKSR